MISRGGRNVGLGVGQVGCGSSTEEVVVTSRKRRGRHTVDNFFAIFVNRGRGGGGIEENRGRGGGGIEENRGRGEALARGKELLRGSAYLDLVMLLRQGWGRG